MKTKNKYFVGMITALTFIGIACSNNKNTTELEITKKFDVLSDTTYVGGVGGLSVFGRKIYISDYRANRVYCVDDSFRILQILGQPGNGPGEFNNTGEFTITDSLIFITSANQINVFYVDGKYNKSYINFRNICDEKFVVDKQHNIYFSRPSSSGKLISKIDSTGKIIGSFGELINKKENFINARNYGNILNTKENDLLYISKTEPVIRKYSMTGKLLMDIDLSENSYVKKRMKRSEEFYKKNPDGHGSSPLSYTAFIDNNKLYILSASFSGDKIIRVVHMLNLNSLKVEKTFILDKNSFYRKMVVFNDNLILFDPESGTFDVYNVSNYLENVRELK